MTIFHSGYTLSFMSKVVLVTSPLRKRLILTINALAPDVAHMSQKTEITIDNQHVTKSLQMYKFLRKQLKENTEKITNLPHFLVFGWV